MEVVRKDIISFVHLHPRPCYHKNKGKEHDVVKEPFYEKLKVKNINLINLTLLPSLLFYL